MFKKTRGGGLLFVLLNALAIGLYQSAICVSLGLFGILIISDLINGKKCKNLLFDIFKQIICIALSLVLYYALYYITLKIFHVNKDGAYNSSDRILFFGLKRTAILIIKTYILFFRNLVLCSNYQDDGVFKQFSSSHEIYLLISFFIALYFTFAYFIRIFSLKKISVKRMVLTIIILALLPFAFACICVIANGLGSPNLYLQDYLIISLPFVLIKSYKTQENNEKFKRLDLTVCLAICAVLSFIIVGLYFVKFKNNQAIKTFIYQLLLLAIIGTVYVIKGKEQIQKRLKNLLFIFISVGVIFNGISYANAQSSKNYLISQKRLALSAIMVQTIESVDGVGESPNIYLYGDAGVFDEEIHNFYVSYLNVFFKKTYVCVNESLVLTEAQKAEVETLNVFPSKNCAKMIDGVLIIKLSETE